MIIQYNHNDWDQILLGLLVGQGIREKGPRLFLSDVSCQILAIFFCPLCRPDLKVLELYPIVIHLLPISFAYHSLFNYSVAARARPILCDTSELEQMDYYSLYCHCIYSRNYSVQITIILHFPVLQVCHDHNSMALIICIAFDTYKKQTQILSLFSSV